MPSRLAICLIALVSATGCERGRRWSVGVSEHEGLAWASNAAEALEGGRCEAAARVLREVEESGRVEVWYMLYADACSSCYLRTGELAYRDAGLTALAQGENTYPMSSRIRFRHGLFLEVIEEPELARRKLMEAREVAERIVAGAEGSESVDEAKLILEAATRRLGRHPSRTTPSEEVPVGDRGSSGGQGEPVSTGAQISPRVGS